MRNPYLLLILLFFHFEFYTSLTAATHKSGVITRNERWTAEEGPYIITDDLVIEENVRVIVTPGVHIMVGRPVSYHEDIEQINHVDSFTVSIKIKGSLRCVGRFNNRIIFSAQYAQNERCQWYGIIAANPRKSEIEIAFCDIVDACYGVHVVAGNPLIRNSVLEYNNVGICIGGKSQPTILNCIVAHNATTGIVIDKANPSIMNTIISFNRNYGIWSDNISEITLEYNCIFGNPAGNLSGCNPEFGILIRQNKNKDSTDFAHNIFKNPVFAGSPADSIAAEKDLSLPTDKSKVKDTLIAKVIQETYSDSTAIIRTTKNKRYSLSRYSPCIDAGKKGKIYDDRDGSRNDMGIFGGQEFIDLSE